MARLSKPERREQLLAVGRRVFAERPYEAVSIDELAQAAEVSKGLLYHYFPDKRAYYAAILRASAEDVLACTVLSPEGPPGPALQGALLRFIRYVADNEPFYRALVRGMGPGADDVELVEEVRLTILERVRSRLDLPGDEPTRSVLYGWVGYGEFVVLDWLADRPVPPEALAERVGRALMALLESR